MSHPIPSSTTLKKYGLTLEEWIAIWDKQGGMCPICTRSLENRPWATDHEHVRGWKKLPPEEKKKYVRGITCTYCNYRLLFNGVTLEKAKNVVKYLEAYEKKKTTKKGGTKNTRSSSSKKKI